MTRPRWFAWVLLILMSLTLAACDAPQVDIDKALSGQDTAVVLGKHLFSQPTIGEAAAPGCVTCHSLEPGVVVVGPPAIGMATRAVQAQPGVSAAEYLRASILEPDALVATEFVPGTMYANYGADLTEDEINALVAYLLTLE